MIRNSSYTPAKRTHNSPEKIKEDDESHREETKSTHLRQEQEFSQIVDCRVDPSSTLRQQNAPRARRDCVGDGIRRELHLECRKVLHHQRSKISVLSKREQVLLVQSVDVGLGVFFDDHGGDDDRPAFVCGSNPINRETTGKTGDRAEKRLEGFGQVVRDVVFVDLRFSSPSGVLCAKRPDLPGSWSSMIPARSPVLFPHRFQ